MTPEFDELFESVMTDDVGESARKAGYSIGPVHRGEHGADPAKGGFQSRLPSLSFGSMAAAKLYSTSPNNRSLDKTASAPRIRSVYLKIDNPVVSDPDDPFIDFKTIERVVGRKRAAEMAVEYESHIMNTNNWEENFSGGFQSVEELLRARPESLGDLYMDAYVILDDPGFVAAAREAGYDGAIKAGTGENAMEPEYQIFDSNQAKLADPVTYDDAGDPIPLERRFDPSNPDIRY